MKLFAATIALFPAAVFGASPWLQGRHNETSSWSADQFKNFILFGDSYSDEWRFAYFIENNGSAPPAGTLFPVQPHSANGGRVWARYVQQYTKESLMLYNYAVDGGACTNRITPRLLDSMGGLYPSIEYPDIEGYEIPAFLADKAYNRLNGTDTPLFDPLPHQDNSIYVIFDGTNDLSINAFFTDSQVGGYVLSDFVDCLYTQFDTLYNNGGRYFVLFNLIPLELAPLFANATQGGQAPIEFWPDRPSNLTDTSERMKEYVTTLNSLIEYRTPFEVLLNERYPGVKVALFDIYSLMIDIRNQPSIYLNGTQPGNITGHSHDCDVNGMNCIDQPSPDSYEFYDVSHPSEETHRIIARNFVELLNGQNQYTTFYESDK